MASGYGEQEMLRQLEGKDIPDLIGKPFDHNELVARIWKLIADSSAAQEA